LLLRRKRRRGLSFLDRDHGTVDWHELLVNRWKEMGMAIDGLNSMCLERNRFPEREMDKR